MKKLSIILILILSLIPFSSCNKDEVIDYPYNINNIKTTNGITYLNEDDNEIKLFNLNNEINFFTSSKQELYKQITYLADSTYWKKHIKSKIYVDTLTKKKTYIICLSHVINTYDELSLILFYDMDNNNNTYTFNKHQGVYNNPIYKWKQFMIEEETDENNSNIKYIKLNSYIYFKIKNEKNNEIQYVRLNLIYKAKINFTDDNKCYLTHEI